jgi:dethiobiotin synthetase
MKRKGIFITGTDTNVGKTWFGSQLCKTLRRHGTNVIPRKPVESGCELREAHLHPADAAEYFHACDELETLELICPFRFSAPLAPDRAAALEGKTLLLNQLISTCNITSADTFLIVEGAGGFYSPIANDGLNADLAAQLNLPVLLIAEDRLGAIHQILTTTEAIQHRGLDLLAVVLNRKSVQHPQLDNLQFLQARLSCPVIFIDSNHAEDAINKMVDLLGNG